MGTEEITFMWKTANSWTGDCPALYKTGGGYYVQVKRVTDPAIRARLEALGRANDCRWALTRTMGSCLPT
jgi:hypothetical protein